MPRFYMRRLRAGLSARPDDGALPAAGGVAVLEPVTIAGTSPAGMAVLEPVTIAGTSPAAGVPAGATEEMAAAPRRRGRWRAAAEEIITEAVMTEQVAELTGVTPETDAMDAFAPDPADSGAIGDQVAEAEATEQQVGGAPRRRRRRGRRGHGHGETETAAAEASGELPGEPGLPPEPVAFDEDYMPDVPPSSHLTELVQRGALVLPEPRGRRRRRGRGGSFDRVEPAPPVTNGHTAEPAPAARRLEPAARGGRTRDPLEDLIARQNVMLDRLIDTQGRMLREFERMMMAFERRGGGGGAATTGYAPRVGVFVDVPNIVYAADKIGVTVDWGKVLHYLTRERQLVRATAYSPISDDSYQRTEMQRFVQPFYHLPYRIMTKPMKRFGNGEIKANFDVELAIDVVTMADRLDIVCLVSGDGDFRRMVELVQGKGVRVEVVAFSSSTAGELRAVCDEYVDFSQHLQEFCITK